MFYSVDCTYLFSLSIERTLCRDLAYNPAVADNNSLSIVLTLDRAYLAADNNSLLIVLTVERALFSQEQ